ncbi:MAG: AsmA family protein [Bauldia sp.]|nr:AsmA family protein [Bauldia sp.]
MIALFAALIGPWFINWDDYKANFEAEAEKILGQPVHVVGSADASILPSPSLTFTNVEVGDTEGQPMMTVEKFSVTIELLPLMQGEIRVISMKLEKPTVRVSVDDRGQVDWLLRTDLSRELNPESVVLNGVEVTDGTLLYTDAGAGSTITLRDIRASIEARTLAGPWRIEGSTSKDGVPVQFTVATGSVAADGKLRVKVDATPGQLPIAIGADGVIGWSDAGLTYVGTYNLTQIVAAEGREPGDSPGWRSEGSFNLTREQLIIDKAILTEGPPDRPSSLAGSMTVDLGENARFEATVQARQLDLDRSLGEGPTKPVEVGTAADSFVEWLAGIPVPPIPGRVRFNVPGIVVGGSVIQDVRFVAMPEDAGWQIEGLQARLPGQASFQADGRLSTGERVGFGGVVRLAVGQPATFANWWRGKNSEGAGRLLAPFDLSGRATVNLGGVAVEGMTTRIGDATITGGFSWSRATADSPERKLRTDLEADRLDFVQIKALAELLGGRDFADATAIADNYTIKLSAGELAIEDVVMRGVMIDAAFAGGGLAVNGIEVGDIGGASLKVTRGQIDDVLTEPLGRIEAQLTAGTLTGLARVIDRIAPDTRFSRWFLEAAPSLAPASLGITIDSVLQDGAPNSRLDIKGAAAATNFDATIEFAGAPEAWRTGKSRFSGSLSSYDAVGVARQVGLDPVGDSIGGARISFSAEGIPAEGLAAKLQGTFGGLTVDSAGTLVLARDLPATYAGTFGVETEDIEPLVRMVGLGIPGAALGTPVRLAGDISSLGPSAELSWTNGQIAGHRVSGSVRAAPRAEGGVSLEEGDLFVDTIDAGWVASLGLGFSPLPGDDPEAPWSKTAFSEPVFGHLEAAFDLATEELTFGNALRVTNAKLAMSLEPNRVEFDVKSGETLGGDVVGGFSIRNVGGNANVTGRMSLVGGALDTIIWQRAGRAVATGTLDMSADFEATGRSPAGLISSLTGGGTLAIHDGEARYVNPRAANLVIRASDIGQQFNEDQLRDLFASYIDGGSMSFAEAEAAFSIAAGTLRIQNMSVKTPDAGATGSAAIDLNTMTIDSDWTLTLDSGDVDEDGSPPQVGIVFRGPLSEPSRIFDVLQFNSYLNIRQEERIQQILIMEEEARLEKERLNRLRRKLREDGERREREAEAARQARIAAARNVSDLHVMRDRQAEARAAAENAAWWERMTAAAETKAAAEQAASDAAAAAEAEKQRAAEASRMVEEMQAAIARTSEAQRVATEELTRAENAAADAAGIVVDRQQALEAAKARAEAAADTVEDAEAALAEARATREAAGGDVGTAAEGSDAALAAVAKAGERLKVAKAAADEAAARAGELADRATALAEVAQGRGEELAAAKADATVKAETEVVAVKRRGEAQDDAAATAERAKATLTGANRADANLQAAVEFAKQADAALERARADAAAIADARKAAEAALGAARARSAEADKAVADARATVAELVEASNKRPLTEPGDVTLGGGNSFDNGTARLEDARAALIEAEAAAANAKDAVTAAEAKVGDLTEQVADSGKTVDAAQVALKKATDEAQSLVEPANAAQAVAQEADAAARAASLTAEAAATAAENAAATAREAEAFVQEKERSYQEAAKAVADARAAAEQAAEEAEAARADVAKAEAAFAEAQAAAMGAADDRAAAEALAADATAAERAAEDKAAGARSRLEQATRAVDLAEQVLAEAEEASTEATALVDEKAAAEAAALGEAGGALDELHAAEAAAKEAAAKADGAAAAARDAARRAAELPRGWVEGRANTGDRADVTIDGEAITGAATDVEEAAVLTDLPVADDEAALAPHEDMVPPPVMPRPRPNRPTVVDDGPKPVPQARSNLPTDAEPLVISPPN